MEKKAALAALAGLAQESRLDVFRLLVEHGPEGLPAGAIAERLGMANATLSFHLKELSHAGLVTSRQAGRFIYYSAHFATVNGLVDYLTENCCKGASCVAACIPSPPTQEEDPMKRFHVHVAVTNLDEGIAFYSRLFGAQPTVRKPDYAKWMVEDPRVNFAISARGGKPGVNHLGFELDSDDEFKAMHAQLAAADAGLVEEIGANCCYARSDKYWVTDPAGVAWETYHTLGSIPLFGAGEPDACCTPESAVEAAAGCCAPAPARVGATIPVKAKSGCCS